VISFLFKKYYYDFKKLDLFLGFLKKEINEEDLEYLSIFEDDDEFIRRSKNILILMK